jgi:AraC-like DNA-binding protein
MIARGTGWTVRDVICTAGPQDRAFEERHGAVALAIVTAGTFQYRSSVGSAVLTPGAVMLGAPGVCFECGHEHGVGDRCLAFHYQPEAWDEIVVAIPKARRGAIARPSLPPGERLAPLLAEAEVARDEDDAEAFDELALRLAGAVIGTLNDSPRRAPAPSTRDIRRVTAIVRRIEAQPEEPARLEDLARDAAMSPYHFLRTFRGIVGLAPHQYVLRTRLHRAALRLRRSRDEISAIAFDSGFNDLSTFNRQFKRMAGMSPGAYRARRRTG